MDRYPVDNLSADGEIMHFDWMISRNVTEIPGTVAFLVCVMKTDTEGNEERHWNSELNQDCYISAGMESEEHPALNYPDEVTQLLLRMATVEQINVQAEEMQTLYENTQAVAAAAEETKNQALDASGHIKNSYASAIKGNVSGEIIRVDDVSPIEHDVKCFVHGKNLLNNSKFKIETKTQNGVTCTANADGSYTISGANTSSSFTTFGSNRSFNYENEPLIPSGIYTPTPGITVVCRDEVTRKETNYQQTFEATNPFRIMGWYCYVGPNNAMLGGSYTQLPTTIYPQLERGSIATDYESYIDPATATVTGCGKNMAYENTINIIGTAGTSGSVGSFPNSVLVRDIPIKKDISYVISMNKPDKITTPRVFLYNGLLNGLTHTAAYNELIHSGRGVEKIALNGAIVNTEGYEYMAITIGGASAFAQGDSVNVTVSNLQLEIGDVATSYEPYSGSIVIPSSDGTCTVTSGSPTMTLFTDTPGVTIEAEYNRDTNKVFESCALTDEAKSEIAGMVESDMAEVLASLNEYATSLIGGGS
jgi:hypothetical protein